MAKINLRDLYPYYIGDSSIEIPDDVLKEIKDCEREEKTYQRYLRRYNVTETIDGENASEIEHMILDKPLTPYEEYERKQIIMFLHAAIAKLPDKQAKRIYAHFFLCMSYTEIAMSEGVGEYTVRESIRSGLRNLSKILKNIF